MVSSSPESNFFEPAYQPKHYFSRDDVSKDDWMEDNEERLNHLYNYINEYSDGVAVKLMDKCTYSDFCDFVYMKSTVYQKNVRYMYTSN